MQYKLIEFVENLNLKLDTLYEDEGFYFAYTTIGYAETVEFNDVRLWDSENDSSENIEQQVTENFQKYVDNLCLAKSRLVEQ